ncbi:hypothetical protein HA402_003813 [Bradysia odoriphaga]|nr:hypothetical protein HA402_003813 [Bradysia odoriphaga]
MVLEFFLVGRLPFSYFNLLMMRSQHSTQCKIGLGLEYHTVVENQQDLIVHVGDNEVVQGIDMALPLMGLGETAEVVCESRFAYGTTGLKNDQNPSASVPRGAKVTYTVELLSCDEEGDLVSCIAEDIALTQQRLMALVRPFMMGGLTSLQQKRVTKELQIKALKLLILHGLYVDEKLVARLILLYFNPTTEAEVNQILSLFFETLIHHKKQVDLHTMPVPLVVNLFLSINF